MSWVRIIDTNLLRKEVEEGKQLTKEQLLALCDEIDELRDEVSRQEDEIFDPCLSGSHPRSD